MTNYRMYKIVETVSASTSTTAVGDYPVSGTLEWLYKGTWGILVVSGSTGAVSMSGGGVIDVSHLIAGQPIPCYPSFISCSSGTIYVLA